jgi:hypothetical protein
MSKPFTPQNPPPILFTKQRQSRCRHPDPSLGKYAADYSLQMTNLKHLLSTLHYDSAVRVRPRG